MMLDGLAHEVVGVAPAGFAFPDAETEFWTPLLLTAGSRSRHGPARCRAADG